MSDLLVDGELMLYGTVGDDLWGDGFTARQVVTALAEVGRGNDVVVRLNSGGGYATEGAAIYNALAAHPGHKTIYVDGVAASAASLLAMAGDQIVMRKGAVLMIHDPASITLGTAADHAKSIESLNALADSFADIYASKSGRTRDEARADMREEIWLTADQAVERGYASAIIEAEAAEPTMFAYHLYSHPPKAITAKADVSKPSKAARVKAAAAVAPQSPKETPMANQDAVAQAAEQARAQANEAVTAHKERCKAILSSGEAKGREDLAHHLAFETDITAEAAIAALGKAPKALAEPAPAANRFEAAMAAVGNPNVGPDGPAQMGGDSYKPGTMAEKMRRQLNLTAN